VTASSGVVPTTFFRHVERGIQDVILTDEFPGAATLHDSTTANPTHSRRVRTVDWKLELVLVPVTDVDRAKAFYAERLGFTLDVDHHPNEHFRVVQLTPPGSACSITFGVGITDMAPGSLKGLHLVVPDIEAARAHLAARGVETGELHHYADGERRPGVDPNHSDYGTFLPFSDLDGNAWLIQEVGHGRRQGS
jgi:catechol 2,3-dioxygenase-like lactoylglutathione lyase family enzyme